MTELTHTERRRVATVMTRLLKDNADEVTEADRQLIEQHLDNIDHGLPP